MTDNLLRFSAAVVLVHAAFIVPHGLAHAAEQAYLPAAANAFVAIVIVAAPLAALGLLRRRQRWLGGLLLLSAMLGALLFGIIQKRIQPGVITGPGVMRPRPSLRTQIIEQVAVRVEQADRRHISEASGSAFCRRASRSRFSGVKIEGAW